MNRECGDIITPTPRVQQDTMNCVLDAEAHCITCADEALEARVLSVDEVNGLALVAVNDATEEVDITLVESVAPGDLLLVHGGVAIAHLGEMSGEV